MTLDFIVSRKIGGTQINVHYFCNKVHYTLKILKNGKSKVEMNCQRRS